MTLLMVFKHLVEGCGSKQRRIPTDDQRLAFLITQQRFSLHNRMTSPQLLFLQSIFGPIAQRLLNGFGTIANHRHDVVDLSFFQLT